MVFGVTYMEAVVLGANVVYAGEQCWPLYFSSRPVSSHGDRVQRHSERSAVEDHDNDFNRDERDDWHDGMEILVACA